MNPLSSWIQEHRATLGEAVGKRLSATEKLHSIAHVSAEKFTDAFLQLAASQDTTPLQAVLDEWAQVQADNLLEVLLAIRADIAEEIRQTSSSAAALDLLAASDTAFKPAILHLARLEKQPKAQNNPEWINKHKIDFIAVASHELKTPLTLIEGYAHMLKADFPTEDYPRAASMLKGILNGTLRLREIIEDMIDTSTIEMQVMDFNYQQYWITRLLDIVLLEMNKLAAERSITITFNPNGLPTDALYGDPERLYQMFVKIVENAIKYTPDGGAIQIYGAQREDMVEIMIQDSGIGLNPEDIEYIFEKFFSLGQVGLHSSSKTKFKGGGPGLGLAIARGIVEAHSGKIWVESAGYDEEQLPGSCFHVLLPLKSGLPNDTQVDYPLKLNQNGLESKNNGS